MKRNSFFNLFVSAVLASFISFNRLNSQEIAGIANSLGSGEDLFFMEIPTVISSSKREQLITEAASSVEIVTAEDIKTSGATNLADALRSVSGLDIRQTNAGQHVIGIRGFADTAHVLVTLDGNNVFMYHANHIFLDWIPLAIEEIDRIEIIKGPGAIFYGGNAFSGVINIITKTPEELEGTQVNVLYGTQHTLRTNIINAAAFDNWQYTVTASMAEADKWDFPGAIQESDRYYNKSVSGKLIRKFDDNSKLTLGLRHSDSANVISGVCQPRTTFLYSRYDKEDFWARLFYGHHRKTFWGESFGVDDSNYEFETMKTFKFDKHILSIGLFAKHSEWEIKSFGLANPAIAYEDHSVNDLAINIEDEFHITNNFIISLGGRFEYNTYLHNLGLGRLSFIYKLPKEQNIRFTVANGYYMPSLFQQTNRGNAYPFAIGNRNLKEEKILSYELAYSNRTIKGL
ncbi:MAG: TonB-dependent receptor, partial [Verrucomicrobiota bacterium]|nr:TonB-dependent receptor [Verrucomicrobiota bacterium]